MSGRVPAEALRAPARNRAAGTSIPPETREDRGRKRARRQGGKDRLHEHGGRLRVTYCSAVSLS
jgi:hypothetical protein